MNRLSFLIVLVIYLTACDPDDSMDPTMGEENNPTLIALDTFYLSNISFFTHAGQVGQRTFDETNRETVELYSDSIYFLEQDFWGKIIKEEDVFGEIIGRNVIVPDLIGGLGTWSEEMKLRETNQGGISLTYEAPAGSDAQLYIRYKPE